MSELPFAVAPVIGLLAATPVAGFALQNGTPAILTWIAPNDGQLHRVFLLSSKWVTSAETGGAVSLTLTNPNGQSSVPAPFGGGSGAGGVQGTFVGRNVQAGSTVTLAQSSALTAGATVLWAELWGS